MKSEGKPMNNEKMQTEIDVGAEKERQELSAYPRISEFAKEIDNSLFRDELRAVLLLLTEPNF
jgi:hypothetical protein